MATLAVFGGTGTVGRSLLPQALSAGHTARLLARTPAKITQSSSRLTVLAGDAKDPDAVRRTVAGADAVVTMLGGFADPDSIRIGTAVITSAMEDLGVRRIVIVQGYHLDFPGDPHNLGRKLVLPMLRSGSRSLIADSRAMATAIQTSSVSWTVVRVPRVTQGRRTGQVRIGALQLGPWDSVVNADVADLVLRCLNDPTTIGAAPMIAHGRRADSPRPVLGVWRTLRDIVRPPRPPEPDGIESSCVAS
jgi:putative NADH-flavin reductase